ncbi:MAG: 16S rRNA (cytosine(967)-C(5))-methyltransferase RsmB [Firmicutes bacterium]|nr:16S rRNA (cytosine(967)-C(5))-methyltransferase RsmB [Bacillota bacterium]
MNTPRGKALQAITAVLEEGAYSHLAINRALQGANATDAAFIKQLVYGTLTYRRSIDYLLAQWLTRPLSSLTAAIRNVLRLGLYQILYLDVPDHAAVNESVKLAHQVGHKGVAGLVNAVLRRAVRSKAALPWPNTDSAVYDLSIRYSFPEWMVRRWLKRFSRAETEALCAAHNAFPGTDLRVNTLRTTADDLLRELQDLGVEANKHPRVANSLQVGPVSLPNLPALQAGRCTVQGAASTLVGQVVEPQPGQLVYDVCAAPGGKALHLAELMQDRGRVVALDVHAKRLGLVREAAERMQIGSVETRCVDATKLSSYEWELADRVLVDAPCSGLGVIRRKPDIRWHRKEEAIAELAALQLKIISEAAPLVKPGGVLVYSVCSTEPEETTAVVAHFLKEHPDFQPAPWPGQLAEVWEKEVHNGCLYTYPHRHNLDGFFICRLRRSN